MRNDNKYSSFWADCFSDDDDTLLTSVEKQSKDFVKLTSYKKSIANFVAITTNKDIPVKFNQRGDGSYTDGKIVTISAKMNDSDFDSTVGLALHEGSHVKLTDFKILSELVAGRYPDCIDSNFKQSLTDKYQFTSDEQVCRYINSILKDILNIIEDRRIDNYIYTTAPGYKGYYHAMYDRYFNDKLVDTALQSTSHRTSDWDSYMFRLINIVNKNRDLDALPLLRSVFNLIDLSNINRLKNTTDAYNLAAEIFVMIENSLPSKPNEDGDAGRGDESTDGESTDGESTDGESGGDPIQSSGNSKGGGGATSSNSSNGMDDSIGDSVGSEAEKQNQSGSGSKPGSGGDTLKRLSPRQEELLKKKIENQKKFQNGDVKKTSVSKSDNSKIETLSESGLTEETAGTDFETYSGRSAGVPVIIVNKLTKSLIDSGTISMLQTSPYSSDIAADFIRKGVQLGTSLGRRLKVRSESKSLFTTRLNTGKIDRRLINEIGYGNTRIFSTLKTENRKKAFIHISIDASSSMGTNLFGKAQTTAVAIAKAASMTNNMDVVISYRATESMNRDSFPLVLIAYDSRKDKFSKITSLFKHIQSSGTTPEGLCYEVIKKNIIASVSADTDTYLLNISDGMPGFSSSKIYYNGTAAENHTRTQVQSLQASGVKVLSYYVTSYGSGSALTAFRNMYGKTAESINMNELSALSKSLNKLFE